MENLGSYLKREREFRQINLIEIAEATRINAGTLQALEEERFEELPGKAFVRGYLKSYARHVGLDVADVLLRYEHLLAHGTVPTKSDPEKVTKRPRRRPWRILWMTGVLAVIVGLAAYLSLR